MSMNQRRSAFGTPTNAGLAGDALFGETAYAQSRRAQAKALDIGERVHLAGFQHGLASAMNALNVLVRPYT
jgi:hypothetical protein